MRISKIFAVIFALLVMVSSLSLLAIGQAEEQEEEPQTRGTMSESEPNDTWLTADVIATSQLPMTISGTLLDPDYVDWFKITLPENKRLEVDCTSLNYDLRVFIMLVYPGDEGHFGCIDTFWYQDLGSADEPYIYTPYDGDYYIQVTAAIYWDDYYDIVVSTSDITPVDSYNNMDNAYNATSTTSFTTEAVDENQDAYDWFYVDEPDNRYPTNISAMITQTTGLEQTTDFDGYDFYSFSELTLYIAYETKDDPGNLKFDSIQVSSATHSPLQATGTAYVEANATRFFIGVCSDTKTINGSDPADGPYVMEDANQDGWGEYDLDINFRALEPDFSPQLYGGSVTPLEGRTTDTFKYSVGFRDKNNNTPDEIKVTIDGSDDYTMTKKAGQGTNHELGVIYEASVPGTTLGEGPHTYKFWANDTTGLPATGDTLTHNGPTIDDNRKPTVSQDPSIVMNEDDPPKYLDLMSYVNDQDGDDLIFKIRDGVSWTTRTSTDLGTYDVISSNKTLLIDLNENQFGEDTLYINVSDAKSWVVNPLEITVTVLSVNDPPEITKVGTESVIERKVTVDIYEDEWTNFTVTAEDPVEGDTLTFSSDIGSVVKNGEYIFDDSTGAFGILPTNDDAYTTLVINITCSDGTDTDHVKVHAQVINTNDPPTVSFDEPKTGDTISGKFNVTWTFMDIDLNDVVEFEFEYSSDNGTTWEETNAGVPLQEPWFLWDVEGIEEGDYLIKVTANDGFDKSSDEIGPITVTHEAVADDDDITPDDDDITPDDDDVEPDDDDEPGKEEEIKWFATGFASDKDGSDSVIVVFNKCKVLTDIKEDSPAEGKTTTTITYELSGSCGSDVEVIHIYFGTQMNDDDFTFFPFSDPNTGDPVEITPSGGVWSRTIIYTVTIDTPEPPEEPVDPPEPTDDVFVQWFLAVGWNEDAEYGTDMIEADTTADKTGGEEGLFGGNSIFLWVIVGAVVFLLFLIIIILIIAVVARSKKKESAPQPQQEVLQPEEAPVAEAQQATPEPEGDNQQPEAQPQAEASQPEGIEQPTQDYLPPGETEEPQGLRNVPPEGIGSTAPETPTVDPETSGDAADGPAETDAASAPDRSELPQW